MHAATKKYVDDKVSASSSGGGGSSGSGSSTVRNSDLNMNNHKITNLGTPSAQTDAVTKEYADNIEQELLNGTSPMTGSLNMGNQKIENLATPTQNTDAVTKKYVDDGVQSKLSTVTGGSMNADIDMNSHKILRLGAPVANEDAVNKKYSDDGDYRLLQDIQKNLPLKGGFMKGAINMDGNHRILGVPTPTTNDDVANKKYVDDADAKLKKYVDGKPSGGLNERNVVIVDKTRYRVQYSGGTYQGFSFAFVGKYAPTNSGWGTDFRWNPYWWEKVPLLGNQKSIHFSDSPLNNKHKLSLSVKMPNDYWTAGSNFGMVFATKFSGNNTITSVTLDVIDQSSNAENMDIKKLGDVTVNSQTYGIYLGYVTHRGNNVVTHTKLEFLFTGSDNTQGHVYNGFIFDGYTKTQYDNANLATNPNFPHFPGFDRHKFVDSTSGDILLAGVHNSADDTVTVKKLRIDKINLSAYIIKILEHSEKEKLSASLKFGTMTKGTKLYSGTVFPVPTGTRTIHYELLTHKFSGTTNIPNDLVLDFGMKFYKKNPQPSEKALTHLRYVNYVNQSANIGKKSDILVNYYTE